MFVSFRTDRKTRELLKEIARMRGMDLADFMRELVKKELAKLGYLSEEEKKVFGLIK